MKYKLITATSSNGGIGNNGTLPWRIKEDLAYFSKMTKGNGNNAVVMGRKTWESLKGRTLVGRDNLILSSTMIKDEHIKDNLVKAFKTTDLIDNHIAQQKYEEVWIIGGGEVYKKYLETDKVDTCYITLIKKEYDCDTYFPELNDHWVNTENTMLETNQDFDVEIRKFLCVSSTNQNKDCQ